MITTLTKVTILASSFALPVTTNAQEAIFQFGRPSPVQRVVERGSERVVQKQVQKTPQYRIRRAEVISGSRVTLFANFLQDRAGYVFFDIGGTSTECLMVDWKNDSVTVDMPRLGLHAPMAAQIRIVLPDGRVAKTFKVLYVSQPDIVVHGESVPQPTPAVPVAGRPVYAQPGSGFAN